MGKLISKFCQFFSNSSTKVYQANKESHSIHINKQATIIQNNEDGYDKYYEEIVPKQRKQFKWRSGELIGQGSYARVYMGMILSTGKMIAVKQIELGCIDKVRLQAFHKEIEILSNLQHPNIVEYYGCETKENQLNILLEFVGGGSLALMIKKFGKFSEQLVQSYLRQILNGLVYLHTKQVIHRDIKGANILVDTKGVCKLADFGCSTLAEEFSSLSGSPNWMAPEVINQQQCGRQADIWSLGCIVLEMLTGLPPWGYFQSPFQAMLTISSKTTGPEIPEGITQDLSDFLDKCLQYDQKKRWTAKQLVEHKFMKNNHKSPTKLIRKRSVIEQKTVVQEEKDIEDLRVAPQMIMRREISDLDGVYSSIGSGQSCLSSMLRVQRKSSS